MFSISEMRVLIPNRQTDT